MNVQTLFRPFSGAFDLRNRYGGAVGCKDGFSRGQGVEPFEDLPFQLQVLWNSFNYEAAILKCFFQILGELYLTRAIFPFLRWDGRLSS